MIWSMQVFLSRKLRNARFLLMTGVVCSASYQKQNTAKEVCLKLSTKWFKSKKKYYIGDTIHDMINSVNAGFEYFHPDNFE